MTYWIVRRILRRLCLILGQQCSGKRRNQHAVEWCKHRSFHDGPCVTHLGEEFSAHGSRVKKPTIQ